ncbi:hypothetical protein NTD80_21165 [Pseudomonas sp. 13B_2.1_Bac1]|nr:hypothetical protein [Pseudomonas sp. 13B_2.1_Bac1]MCU1785259.1 hypothetical protein [Pseudomonas sp. 13B_2.1_Bac1]
MVGAEKPAGQLHTQLRDCHNSPKYLTDIELRYAATQQLKLAVGVNNVFDVKPDKLPPEST